jgi:hypothetical protein
MRRDEARAATVKFIEAEFMDRSGRRTGTRRIDENRGAGAVQQVHECGTWAVGRDHLAIRRRRFREHSCGFQPRGVIAEGTADSDDLNHCRSISIVS